MLDEGGFGPAFTRANLHDRMEIWCDAYWQKTPSRSWMYYRFNEIEIGYKAAIQSA